LSETQFESEIFGHEAGPLSGEARQRIGKVEHGHGRTLILDKVKSVPIAIAVPPVIDYRSKLPELIGGPRPWRQPKRSARPW
jgi:two-component system C4-dicarboxylate transport response regulator DctD